MVKPTGTAARVACLVLGLFGIATGGSWAQSSTHPVLTFVAATAADEAARDAYEEIWAEDGARIIEAMERISGLEFEEETIGVVAVEEASSSGYGARPMRLRSSYPPDTKRATLIHELGHRLQAEYFYRDDEDHPTLFLYLYDVWVDLYGEDFAREQVAVESRRRGYYDYETAWNETLALTKDERARRLRGEIAARSR